MKNDANVDALYGFRHELEAKVKALKSDPEISPENKQTALDFVVYCQTKGDDGKPLSLARTKIYADRLNTLARIVTAAKTDLKTASASDLRKVNDGIDALKVSDGTKQIYKTCLKKMVMWLDNCESGEPSERIRWLKPNKGMENRQLAPEDLLTPSEIQKMLEACENSRDRAILVVLAESGVRIGELGSMRIKNVLASKFGLELSVVGKTGRRTVLITRAVPHLKAWLEDHPAKSNPEAPLWTILHDNDRKTVPLNYAGFYTMLRKLAARAGIGKVVKPHAFRHAEVAACKANGMNDSSIKKRHGWSGDSRMMETYGALSDSESNRAYLESIGIFQAKEKPNPNRTCPKCGEQNPFTEKWCLKCGAPLSLEIAIAAQDTTAQLVEELRPLLAWLKSNPTNAERLTALVTGEEKQKSAGSTSSQRVVLGNQPDLRQRKTTTAE